MVSCGSGDGLRVFSEAHQQELPQALSCILGHRTERHRSSHNAHAAYTSARALSLLASIAHTHTHTPQARARALAGEGAQRAPC